MTRIWKGEKETIISQSTYDATFDDFKGIWTSERWDWDNWTQIRGQYIGKRTWMPPCALFGYTCLLVEGHNFRILPDKEFDELPSENFIEL